MTDEMMEELKAKHPNSKLFKIVIPATDYDDETIFVVKRPPRAEFNRYWAMTFDAAEKPNAHETLARSCIVYPDVASVTAIFKERAALAIFIGSRVADLAGAEGKIEVKKL